VLVVPVRVAVPAPVRLVPVVSLPVVVWMVSVVGAIVGCRMLGPSTCRVLVFLPGTAKIAKTEARIAMVKVIKIGQPQSRSANGRACRQRSARLALPVSTRRLPQTRQYS